MKNNFDFIDETGLLTSDPKQRFFAIGSLKINEVADFYNQLSKHYHKVLSRIESKRKQRIKDLPATIEKRSALSLMSENRRFEFKFNHIDEVSVQDYLELLDIYFQFPHLKFCALVIDTTEANFNFKQYFPNAWEAYIGYSKMLIGKHNDNSNEQTVVIADFVQMARASTKYFEREINLLPNIFNTCRMESDASLFIQMVDVLLGATAYDFKLQAGMLGEIKPEFPKTQVVLALRKYLNQETLAKAFTIENPNSFSVWPFQSKPQ